MKRLMRYTIAALLLVIFWMDTRNKAAESSPGESHDLPVDPALREQIIDSVISFVRSSYVDSTTGAKAAEVFSSMRRKGTFNKLATASALCDSLTATFHTIRQDKHFRVLFDTEPHPIEGSDPVVKEREEQERKEQAAFDSYGFADVKRLAGNVGYIQLTKFHDPETAGSIAAAVMTLVSKTDALIIDLRNNGGGSGEMVDLMTSYFLPPDPEHLMDVYFREGNLHKQSWSMSAVAGPRYLDRDLYLLINGRTFSAAEGFSYALQSLKRGIVVGEQSRGGAHPVGFKMITEYFAVMLPIATTISPVTDTNWEGSGVTPQIQAQSDQALTVAHLEAVKSLRSRQPHPALHVSYDAVIADLEADLKKTP